jgi:hypothetical protein
MLLNGHTAHQWPIGLLQRGIPAYYSVPPCFFLPPARAPGPLCSYAVGNTHTFQPLMPLEEAVRHGFPEMYVSFRAPWRFVMPKPVSLESPTEVVANPEHDHRLQRRSSAEDKRRVLEEAAVCTERPLSTIR